MIKRLSLLACCVFLGAAGAGFSQDVIKIGEFGTLSGDNAAFGTAQNNGVQIALEEVNAAGGVLGKKIQLIVEDNQTKQGENTTIVRKFISQDHVAALVGESSSSKTLEAAPMAQAAKVPLIATAATNPKVTQTGDYVFRVCFIDDFQGEVIARLVLEKLKKTKVAFLTDVKQDYSVGLTKFAGDYLKVHGGAIVKEQSYSSGDKDFRAQLTDVKAANPDAIIITGYYPEAALLAKQARQFGIKATFVGGDGWDDPATISIGGKSVEESYYSSHFSADAWTPVVQEFVKKYKEKYGTDPSASAALGYDAFKLLCNAIRRAGGTDPEKLRAAIADTKGFEGVSGRITIGPDRNAVKPAVILELKDGRMQYAGSIEPKG